MHEALDLICSTEKRKEGGREGRKKGRKEGRKNCYGEKSNLAKGREEGSTGGEGWSGRSHK
jgi:hypothetical protein